ncbi:hypothetical protein HPP92_010260 [Vanilla planifolia]|uniref:Uncharacterized protein n=1 Tax=Vanilla planifolia TaxID=51239 RepID=A0A835R3R6_VANPL|nr:hypothetical protein HPP92_010260 [Vanilla planifolia]
MRQKPATQPETFREPKPFDLAVLSLFRSVSAMRATPLDSTPRLPTGPWGDGITGRLSATLTVNGRSTGNYISPLRPLGRWPTPPASHRLEGGLKPGPCSGARNLALHPVPC